MHVETTQYVVRQATSYLAPSAWHIRGQSASMETLTVLDTTRYTRNSSEVRGIGVMGDSVMYTVSLTDGYT
jgi:hypothetical protein